MRRLIAAAVGMWRCLEVAPAPAGAAHAIRAGAVVATDGIDVELRAGTVRRLCVDAPIELR